MSAYELEELAMRCRAFGVVSGRDLLWLLGSPIYLLWTTGRHELSHAVVAWFEGARILAVRVLPTVHPQAGFVWGYVSLDWPNGSEPWTVLAAPFIADASVFLVFLFVCMRTSVPRWCWISCFILGLASPLADVGYNYLKMFFCSISDVGSLASLFSKSAVHAVFVAEIAFFIIGIWIAWRTFGQAEGSKTREDGGPCPPYEEKDARSECVRPMKEKTAGS